MKVNSTGLGKTTLIADFEDFQTEATEETAAQFGNKDGDYLVLAVAAFEPVHWSIRITMDGQDLRKFLGKILKPKVAFRMLSLLIRGNRLD